MSKIIYVNDYSNVKEYELSVESVEKNSKIYELKKKIETFHGNVVNKLTIKKKKEWVELV